MLDRYRQGLEKILITTNVLSRGIDIEQVGASLFQEVCFVRAVLWIRFTLMRIRLITLMRIQIFI